MRLSLFILAFFSFVTVAQAEFSLGYEKNCETAEMQSIKSQGGSCRVAVSSKKLVKSGQCSAIFQDKFPCTLSYIGLKDSAVLSMTCDSLFTQDVEAEAIEYRVATISQAPNSKAKIVLDPKTYQFISSDIFSVILDPEHPRIIIHRFSGDFDLTDVQCQ